MKCPYCAEEIKDEAIKCKHCGEWLDQSRKPQTAAARDPDFSDYKLFGFYDPDNGWTEIVAKDRKSLMQIIEEENRRIAESSKVSLRREGKVSCPNCNFTYTKCSKDIGCAILIIIFISLGIGLIIIPFLPLECHCPACGHKWRA
jgi:hypothetical protein